MKSYAISKILFFPIVNAVRKNFVLSHVLDCWRLHFSEFLNDFSHGWSYVFWEISNRFVILLLILLQNQKNRWGLKLFCTEPPPWIQHHGKCSGQKSFESAICRQIVWVCLTIFFHCDLMLEVTSATKVFFAIK